MQWLDVLLIMMAAAVAGGAAGLVIHALRHREKPPVPSPQPEQDSHQERVAFVVNPSKPDAAGLERNIRTVFHEAALPEPLWFETTVADPGVGQAQAALAAGADTVVAVGGDGTVRAVASVLANSGRAMGLIPLGTGNLLARNLDLPIADVSEALRIVIAGVNRSIDVGWLEVTDPDTPHLAGQRHLFLVIAGLGFDAAMVADTDDALKAKVGWMAYFLSGIRHLHGRRIRARITLNSRPPVEASLRTLMIGNCGRLPGGITLLPDAVIDDGILDIAAVDTRGGLMGWAQLLGEVLMQGVGIRTELPAKIGRIDHTTATHVVVEVPASEHIQVDGDVLGSARSLKAAVDPRALIVRVG